LFFVHHLSVIWYLDFQKNKFEIRKIMVVKVQKTGVVLIGQLLLLFDVFVRW
jgi:hypothetical protein